MYFTETRKDGRIAKSHIRDYETSDCDDIYDAYKEPSVYKVRAFNYWVRAYKELNGKYGIRILSHNSQSFSLGFVFEDAVTGVLKFAYITKDYNRVCDY